MVVTGHFSVYGDRADDHLSSTEGSELTMVPRRTAMSIADAQAGRSPEAISMHWVSQGLKGSIVATRRSENAASPRSPLVQQLQELSI